MIRYAEISYVMMCWGKDEVLRLKDEHNSGHESKGASRSQRVARILQEEVAEHHDLLNVLMFWWNCYKPVFPNDRSADLRWSVVNIIEIVHEEFFRPKQVSQIIQ